MDQTPIDPIAETINEDEFIYENIEAPKFVDLRKPDLYKSGDDRHWFCTRFGCDLKHEDEIDPEEIYKSFVQRVMAFRSPNVRLKNAMNKKNSSALLKCPKSVPPKAKVSLISPVSKARKGIINPPSKLKQSHMNSKAFEQSEDKRNDVKMSKTIKNPSKGNAVAKTLVFSIGEKRCDGFGDDKENESEEKEKMKKIKPEMKSTLMRSYSYNQSLKPTKIKPFRLRTDARGILKDNNLQNVPEKEKMGTEEKKSAKVKQFEALKMVKSGSVKETVTVEDKQCKDKTSVKCKLLNAIRHTVSSRQKVVCGKSFSEDARIENEKQISNGKRKKCTLARSRSVNA